VSESGVGTATLDFGATPTHTATVAVTGQTLISATSRAEAFIMGRSTVDNDIEAHNQLAAFARLTCSGPTAGVGFTITAYCLVGAVIGTFSIEYTWSD
jgi:hypothetical protein